MVPWRRAHMSDLVNAFDFDNPDYSVPTLPNAPAPHKDASGNYDGAAYCEGLYAVTRPTVPYNNQISPEKVSSLSEQGFKAMRGALTEGRYIVFELNGWALTNAGKPATDFTASKATSGHEDISQRWVVHQQDDDEAQFIISSAKDGRYIGSHTGLIDSSSGAQKYTISFQAGKGYALQKENGKFVTVDAKGGVQIAGTASYFQAFSVTYSN